MFNIIVVTNRHLVKGDFISQIKSIAQSGVNRLILREKDMALEEYQKLAKKVLEICCAYQLPCSFHYFKELQADNMHLPFSQLEAADEKKFKILGVSCHYLEEAKTAEQFGAHYITYGHVFETACKKDLQPRGLINLEKICQNVTIPVYAIGGISEQNIASVRAAGAAGACIMSSAMQSEEPEKLIQNLKKAAMFE